MGGAPRRGPVGRGYMPKGGVAAAQRSNDQWRERESARAVTASPPVTVSEVAPGARQRAGGGLLAGPSGVRIALLASAASLAADLVLAVTR